MPLTTTPFAETPFEGRKKQCELCKKYRDMKMWIKQISFGVTLLVCDYCIENHSMK